MNVLNTQKLTEQQKQAITLLITKVETGMTDADIAVAVSVSERTLRRWKNENPDFQKEYLVQVKDSYSFLLPQARNELARILSENGGYGEKARVDAIKLVMQSQGMFKQQQQVDMNVNTREASDAVKALMKSYGISLKENDL